MQGLTTAHPPQFEDTPERCPGIIGSTSRAVQAPLLFLGVDVLTDENVRADVTL